MTDKEIGRDYLKKPEKVARITDFYTLDSEAALAAGIPPLLAETLFGEIESRAAPVIRRLVDRPPSLRAQEVVDLALFLAQQIARGQVNRAQHEEIATNLRALQFGSLTDEQLRNMVERTGRPVDEAELEKAREAIAALKDGSVRVAPERAASVALSMATAVEAGEVLLYRAWVVASSPSPLITCDEPVVFLGTRGRPRSARGGVATAAVIGYPLSPYRILMMVHPAISAQNELQAADTGRVYADDLDVVERAQMCREIAMNCYRWVFEHPGTRIGQHLWLPDIDSVSASEIVGMVDATGREAEIHHSYPTTRWAHVPPSWWPTGRWWHGSNEVVMGRPRYRYRGSFHERG